MLDAADHVHALRGQGARLVDALAGADPGAAVPTCPGWDLARLARHVGSIYENVRRVVEEGREWPGDEPAPPPDAELAGWVGALHGRLADVLAAREPDAASWTWLGQGTVAFWDRRMAHETAVHRFDAQSAVDGTEAAAPLQPALAGDALDELLVTMLPFLGDPAPLPGTLSLRCTDTDDAWMLRPHGGRTVAGRGSGPADALVVGPASNVLLAMLRRLPLSVVEVTGDAAVVDGWLAAPRF